MLSSSPQPTVSLGPERPLNVPRHASPLLGDEVVATALDRAGVVGSRLRERLSRDLKAKILLRQGLDAVEVIGASGTGKHKVVRAAHEVARAGLGRGDKLETFRCDEPVDGRFDHAVHRAFDAARGGTLVFERFGALSEPDRQQVTRIMRERGDQALCIAVSDQDLDHGALDSRPATSIRLKPLHEREEDVWELVDHFFGGLAEEQALGECQGFSRQAKADLAEVVRETNLASVRKLRDIVRDIVFETLADGELPLKLMSEHVRPYLERTFGQTEESRRRHDAALVASQFESPDLKGMAPLIKQLADTHGVSPELLMREVEVLREVVENVHGVPRSYRNIMSKAEDIQRAAMWILTGASTQADFRRYFGEEGFMRPTKSVAWAFYNRVFQRES
jgi:hypothetical protein